MDYKARRPKIPLSEASHDGFPYGTVLSLFSGAGGLDIGLEAAGLQTIGYLENNEDCLDTIEMNRPSWKRLHPSDVVAAARRTRTRDLGLRRGELDVIAAGPPCQPFSSAAQWRSSGRLGMEDDRAGTIHATIDLIREFQPKVLVIENVVGFVRADRGAITVIRDGLIKINEEFKTKYGLHFAIVDSADYGVPQHRRRAILIASRDGRHLSLPEPTHRERPVRAWDAIGDLPEPDREPIPLGKWASALLASVPEGGNYQWLTSHGEGEELFGYRTRYWSFLLKLARDRPSWTLSASAGPSTGPFHWNNRQLTVHERLRLQSFPDGWRLSGSTRARVRMAGNATPPLLAEVVGRAIVNQLLNKNVDFGEKPELLIKRRSRVPRSVDPVPVPETLSHLIGKKKAHPGAGLGPSPRSE